MSGVYNCLKGVGYRLLWEGHVAGAHSRYGLVGRVVVIC